MAVKTKRRLLNFLINKPPQRQFVIMQFTMLTLLMLYLLYGSFELFHTFSMSGNELEVSPEQLRLQLKELYASLFIRLLLIFLGGFIVNVFIGLMFLHRVTGPLIRICNVLNDMSRGNIPAQSIRFRSGDLTPELAAALNNLITSLNRKK